MRRHPYTVCVTNNPEVELQWEASVSPVVPAVTQADPYYCHPEQGGEVEDVRLVLGPSQIASARRLLGAFFASGDATDARVEELVQDILTDVLDAKRIQPDDDEFREAASEAGEPDPDEERDKREDR